jgi:hypothetical protein
MISLEESSGPETFNMNTPCFRFSDVPPGGGTWTLVKLIARQLIARQVTPAPDRAALDDDARVAFREGQARASMARFDLNLEFRSISHVIGRLGDRCRVRDEEHVRIPIAQKMSVVCNYGKINRETQ